MSVRKSRIVGREASGALCTALVRSLLRTVSSVRNGPNGRRKKDSFPCELLKSRKDQNELPTQPKAGLLVGLILARGREPQGRYSHPRHRSGKLTGGERGEGGSFPSGGG